MKLSKALNLSGLYEKDKKLFVKVTAGVLLLVVAFAFYLIKDKNSEEDAAVSVIQGSGSGSVEQTTDASIEEPAMIMVDVAGAVANPSVVELPEGSRVFEAVDKAGGFTSDADTRVINQAEILCDGQKLYIPTKEEVEQSKSGSAEAGSNTLTGSDSSYQTDAGFSYNEGSGSSKININTADSVSLQQLTGVGPATAEKIINYRNENGRFQSIEDIKNVSGIGDKTFEKFKDKITV